MIRRGSTAVLIAAALLGAASPAAGAQRRPIVRVVEPRVVAPVVVRGTVTVPVSLRLRAGVRAGDVRVAVRDVVPEPGRPEVRPGGVTLLPADGTFPKHLGMRNQLRVRFDMARVRPGTYTLALEAWRAGARARATSFSVAVGIAPPVLRPTQPLHVERVIGPGDDRVQPLTVRETTSRSRVSVTGLKQVSESSDAGAVAGELAFRSSDEAITPGGVLRVAPVATSGFPVGTSNGTIEVAARELDAPVAVPFIVETRLSLFWLALALFLGLAAGGVARYFLQRRIELGQAQLDLDSLRGRILTERRLHRDGPFQRDTDAMLAEIDRVLEDESDTAVLRSAVTTQQERLSKALEELTERRNRLKPEIERRAAALAVARSLPGVVRRELASVQHLVAVAGEQFAIDAVADAQEQIRAADARFTSGVIGTTSRWRDDVRSLVDAVHGAPALVGEATAAAERAAQLADAAAEPDGDTWDAALDAIAAAHAAVNALRDQLGRAAQAQLDELRGRVPVGTTGGEEGSGPAVERTLIELIGSLEAATGSVLGAFERAAQALRACTAAGQRAGMTGGPPPPTWTAGIASAAFDTGASNWTAPLLFGADGGDAAGRGIWRREVRRGVRAARVVQWVIIATVVLVIGFELFEDDFIGTVEQLVLAFLWAFTADVSLNGVIAVAQQRTSAVQPAAPTA